MDWISCDSVGSNTAHQCDPVRVTIKARMRVIMRARTRVTVRVMERVLVKVKISVTSSVTKRVRISVTDRVAVRDVPECYRYDPPTSAYSQHGPAPPPHL